VDEQPQDQPHETPSERRERNSFTVDVNITGNGVKLTNEAVEDAITAAVNEITPAGTVVTARSRRTDR